MTGKILIDRAVVEQALEAMMATHYKMIDAGILDQDLLNKNFTAHEAIKDALAEQPAESLDGKLVMGLAVIRELTGTQKTDNIEATIEAVRKAVAPQPAVPPGYKLVPVRPTQEMVDTAKQPLNADDLKEPKNGKNWRVEWWNESCRMMLPSGSMLDSFQAYKNGTLQFTIKKTGHGIAKATGEQT